MDSGNHSRSVEDSLTCMGSGNNTKEARDRADLFRLRRGQRYFLDTATWDQAIWYQIIEFLHPLPYVSHQLTPFFVNQVVEP
jgi:hypothetical protein